MSTLPQSPQGVFQTLDRTRRSNYTRAEYFGRIIWKLVELTLFRLPIPRFGHAWRTALLRLFGAKLGKPCGVFGSVRIMHPWLLEMGPWSMLAPRVEVYNLGKITIGSHTVISQDATLCAGTHDYTKPDLPLQRPQISIGSGVWIAAEAFVGPGTVVGDNSVIGARAVVTGQVPPNVVAAGNPCKVIKPRPMNA